MLIKLYKTTHNNIRLGFKDTLRKKSGRNNKFSDFHQGQPMTRVFSKVNPLPLNWETR